MDHLSGNYEYQKENERENESRFWKAKNHAECAWVATEETPVWAGVGLDHAALGRKEIAWRGALTGGRN